MTIIGPFGFTGGWNTKANILSLPGDQLSDAQNIQNVFGDLVKRSGSSALNSSAFASGAAVHGLADWQTAAGQRSLIITAGAAIGKMNDLGGTFTDITGAVTITSGQNNQSTFSSLNNILVRCGGTTPDAPIKWSGTGNAAALGGSPPSGNITAVANNFMFLSGVVANPSRVYWSNVIDPETWGATNYVDFRKSDGDIVTAIAEKDQNLIIFKRRSIGQLWTQSLTVSGSVTLGPLNQVSSGVGCVGSNALDHLPDGRIVFLSPDAHLYIFDGTAVPIDISDPPFPRSNIQPTLDALPAGRLKYASVRVYSTRNQIWLSVSTGSSSTNDTIYVYDYKLQCWQSAFTNIAANVMASVIDTRSVPSHPIIMVTGNYSGTAYEQDTGASNPEATNSIIDGYGTKYLPLGGSEVLFIPRSAIINYESKTSGSLQFNYGYDAFSIADKSKILTEQSTGGKLDQFILDADVLGGPSNLRMVVPLYGSGRSSSIQIQFRNQNSGEDFTVHPFYLSDEVEI